MSALRLRCQRTERLVTPERPDECPRCEVCGAPTQERKPWCVEHADQSPYAQRIALHEARAALEVERVSSCGPDGVDLHGVVAREILAALAERPASLAQVKTRVHWLGSGHEPAASYAEALERAGLVALRRLGRGMFVLVARG